MFNLGENNTNYLHKIHAEEKKHFSVTVLNTRNEIQPEVHS